jgi:HSP20 family protein
MSDKKDGFEFGGNILSGLTGLLGMVEKLAGSADSESAAGKKSASILDGLSDIARKLNDLPKDGVSGSGEREFTFPSRDGGIKGVYGFTVKTGLGEKGDTVKVEPFGNIRKDRKTGEAVVEEIAEPLVDIFEDDKATTLIAEMPGVGAEDIHVEVRDDVLALYAQKGKKKYRKEMLLGHPLSMDRISVTCNNGIVTIRCGKAG